MEQTIKDFLENAVALVGKVMYVYGGGWNEADNGGGTAYTNGILQDWIDFADRQTAAYDHAAYRYQNRLGLDCTGFLGWALYQTLGDHREYVQRAEKVADAYCCMGLGYQISHMEIKKYLPGDILCGKNHVWISLGECKDKSVVLIHASPPGVTVCGTVTPMNQNSRAISLAEQVMMRHYPEWYERFPKCRRGIDYLTDYTQFRFFDTILPDTARIRELHPEELIALLWKE